MLDKELSRLSQLENDPIHSRSITDDFNRYFRDAPLTPDWSAAVESHRRTAKAIYAASTSLKDLASRGKLGDTSIHKMMEPAFYKRVFPKDRAVKKEAKQFRLLVNGDGSEGTLSIPVGSSSPATSVPVDVNAPLAQESSNAPHDDTAQVAQ